MAVKASSRGAFSNKIGFILAAAGSAVGLGNIWKFPFEVSEGGGAAFVVMYLAFCFILCFPVMVAEVTIGRNTGRNPIGAFKAQGKPNWAFTGMLGIIASTLILSFYNVVAAWSLGFTIEIATGNFEIGSQFGSFVSDIPSIFVYSILFLATTVVIVSQGVSSGIEKASKILMPALLIIIISLMIYSLFQEGAVDGIKFYLVPDFSEINLKTIYGALGQAFFSLSLGMGALITYGSYFGKNDNIISSTTLIVLTDVGIAFIAGLMMFSFIFSQGLQDAGGGAGLIFTVLPGAFASIGGGAGQFIGGLFFLLLSFAALTSTVSLLEVPVAYIVDEKGVRRKRAVWIVGFIVFLLGLPSMLSNGASEFFTNFIEFPGVGTVNFMTFVENIASDTLLPISGFFVSVYTAYIWKKSNYYEEIKQGNPGFTKSLMYFYIDFALKYLAPVILSIISMITILDKFFNIQVLN